MTGKPEYYLFEGEKTMRKQKTWKEIEQDRNRRLNITQVWIPVATMVTSIFAASPEARYSAKRFFTNVKLNIKGVKLSAQEKLNNWKEEKAKKKEEKVNPKAEKIDTETKICILTMVSDIEILSDNDKVMAKCNKIRKLLGED